MWKAWLIISMDKMISKNNPTKQTSAVLIMSVERFSGMLTRYFAHFLTLKLASIE